MKKLEEINKFEDLYAYVSINHSNLNWNDIVHKYNNYVIEENIREKTLNGINRNAFEKLKMYIKSGKDLK